MNESNCSDTMARRLRRYLPLATAWVLEQERFILENGVPLTDAQLADAKLAGVSRPGQVRLFRVETIPLPEYPELAALKLTAAALPGLCLRYGIYLLASHWGRRRFVVHELARTAQYERLNGVRAFLECYLFECLTIGVTSAPMEQEVIAITERLCGLDRSFEMPNPPRVAPARSGFIRIRNQK